jgi:hypothetical protein
MGEFPYFSVWKPPSAPEAAKQMPAEVEHSDEAQRETPHLAELVVEEKRCGKAQPILAEAPPHPWFPHSPCQENESVTAFSFSWPRFFSFLSMASSDQQ